MNKGHRIRATRKISQAHSYKLTQASIIGAALGLAGGTVSPLSGALLLAIAWLKGQTGGWLYALGSILLLSTIPLLLIGAHCLDLLDDRKKSHQHQRKSEPENTQPVIVRALASGQVPVVFLQLATGYGQHKRKNHGGSH